MKTSQASEPRLKVQVWLFWVDPTEGQSQLSSLRVLLLKTKQERGGFWQPVTGSVDPGESVETAACREAFEESGLAQESALISLGDPIDFESRWGAAREYPFGLRVGFREKVPPQVKLDEREHESFEWLSYEDAIHRLKFPMNVQMLGELLKKLEGFIEFGMKE